MNSPENSAKLQAPCRHLRSKEMYYQSPGQEDDEFSSGVYWCTATHEPVGPDNQPCGKKECCAGRNCFVG